MHTLTPSRHRHFQPFSGVSRKGAQLLDRAIAGDERMVLKRDGTRARFDQSKVTRAIALAFYEVQTDNAPNPDRDHLLACFGLGSAAFGEVMKISAGVAQMLELYYREGRHPTIEQVQDAVEKAIAAAGHWEVARAYMLYRARHAERRLAHFADNGMSDYIVMAKYARYRPELGRREIFVEGVERVRDMHLEFFAAKLARQLSVNLPADVAALAGENAELLARALGGARLDAVIAEAFSQVAAKKVLPSMRSMQFGGPAILKNHSRMFNCSFS
ncbi:MAG TPA: ATP cone domain-containing protein, partial [Opitutus sp.]|nr:ATP cone domain-containing protein [Opitutus sp.]